MKPEPIVPDSVVMTEVLNGIPHGIALFDPGLYIVAMNRYLEAMSGYGVDEARGLYGECVLRSNLGVHGHVYRNVLESGESVSIEGNIINRKRRKIPVQFTLSRLHDKQGQVAGLLIVLEDISVLKAVDSKHYGPLSGNEILGSSLQMRKVFDLMSVLARTDASVLITGETGTGKDVLAEALHKSSPRARQPFVKINCGALPESLLESELFGHVKGAFTGAVKDSTGMFLMAHRGTIFLTEIGDLSLPLQVKLLSVLDDQEFYPVGGRKKIKVDVRIIAATHRSLRKDVQQGRFRKDLFYRLNILQLHVPPLRERDGDINLLLDHFLRRFSGKLGREVSGFTNNAIDTLNRFDYPGNVRELRNIVEYAVNICQGKQIGRKDLPLYLFKVDRPPSSIAVTTPPLKLSSEPQKPLTATTSSWPEVEKEMIMAALRRTGGNRSRAALVLGWGRTTLWRKLKKYKLT